MSILFTLAVVSFFALVWAAYAIARHVRRAVPLHPTNPDIAPTSPDVPQRPTH